MKKDTNEKKEGGKRESARRAVPTDSAGSSPVEDEGRGSCVSDAVRALHTHRVPLEGGKKERERQRDRRL